MARKDVEILERQTHYGAQDGGTLPRSPICGIVEQAERNICAAGAVSAPSGTSGTDLTMIGGRK